MKILVIEDDGLLGGILEQFLRAHNFTVDVALNGEEGLNLALQYPYDGIVLDIMLPAIDGHIVLKRLREQQVKTPVLLLTARVGVEDRVRGLDLGADDYLPKPFDYDEFLARLSAIIRRGQASPPPPPQS